MTIGQSWLASFSLAGLECTFSFQNLDVETWSSLEPNKFGRSRCPGELHLRADLARIVLERWLLLQSAELAFRFCNLETRQRQFVHGCSGRQHTDVDRFDDRDPSASEQ